jgi:hypothetical protein
MLNAQAQDVSTTALNEFIEFQSTCNFISYSPNGEFMSETFITLDNMHNSTKNFYTNTFLSSLPANFFSTAKTKRIESSPILIVNNKLFLHKIEKKDWEDIIAKLGKKLTTCALKTKNLKAPPVISVLTEGEYQKLESTILETYISNLKKRLVELQESINNTQKWINTLDAYGKKYGYSKKDLADKAKAQQYIVDYKKLLDEGNVNLEVALTRELTVKDELGSFLAPNKINLLYAERFDMRPNVYVETVIHEQYHYESAKSNLFLPTFFEEGLTQIFTLQTLAESSLPIELTSYPLPVFVIQQMTNKIPLEIWEKIYFSKDIDLLESSINTAFGNDFYSSNKDALELLTYDFSLKSLEKANDFSKVIGGRTLSQEEFYNYSGQK